MNELSIQNSLNEISNFSKEIETIAIYSLQQLFQNKRFVFINATDFCDEDNRELIDGKLVILNEFIKNFSIIYLV